MVHLIPTIAMETTTITIIPPLIIIMEMGIAITTVTATAIHTPMMERGILATIPAIQTTITHTENKMFLVIIYYLYILIIKFA